MESRTYNENTVDNNFSFTMDYEKYYKIEYDGSYNVHFFNKNALTIDQIREIFSKFGEVLAVNLSGNEYGLRFIKFKTLEETIRCIKGLANHDSIKLLLEKSKMNGSSHRFDKKNSSQWQAAKAENSFQRTYTTDKQFNLNSADGKFSGNASLSHNVKTDENAQFNNADNFSDTNSRNPKYSHKSNANAIKYNKLDSHSRQQDSVHLSNKINYEKYYKVAKDGTYIIHFANKKELSLEEIRKLFSTYGHILSLYTNEDKTNGLVFVRYKTLREVEACLEGFQNNDAVTILPQKDKINSTIKRTDKNPDQLAGMQGNQGTYNTGKQFHSNYDKEFSKAREKSIYNTTSNENNRFDNTNNFVETSRISNHSYKSVNTTIYSDSFISNKQYLSSLPSLNQQSINHEVSNYNQEQQQKNTSYISKTCQKFDANTYVNKDIYDEIPALISDTEIKQMEFDAMSDGSSQAGTKNVSKIINIPMQEVIVANIHSNYDAHYILHLFKKYNPIAATLAVTHVGINVRYCHIYFKTNQDAVAIEEEFDNFDLSGKNLIVLRISRLKEEAICK